MENLYYYRSADLAYTAEEILNLYAVDVTLQEGNEHLNLMEIFPVNLVEDTNNPNLYTTTDYYTVVGETADQSWVAAPVDLADAKEYAVEHAKTKTGELIQEAFDASGYTVLSLLASAAKSSADRGADAQTQLTTLGSLMTDLETTLSDIDSATDVDAIDTILKSAYPA